MNFAEIKELLELFEAGSIRELDLNQGDLSLYLNKNEDSRPVVQESASQMVTAPTQVVPSAPVEAAQAPVAESKPAVEAEGTAVKSPIVGVVYTSSEPSAPSFVSVGDKVAVGDTLCIVEAMKIMNEIKSDVAGIVTEILIENEDVVEFGQALFRIA
ncbi:acetyl-CoA carboxylase biotin carboxyl carrier protein [Vagococcus fluvialis]|uniref:acetyl-CoA carboxylase biotin carboxyl carrier protein n=1 Tax=Vagococcus fluvialis TaxID=2738 RepID=UPI001432D525|nr:acetyl-CoA carboxylase biotin carboxyl carrier protein [Vagococcus fluvialis]MBO0488005.1 acetyl-CoA carboxylase biotin carboxyl carrier protein [Vagococcus fluvialis]NKC60022.1 acetyl-CoA carboxylase biotin carboxyl carrier protein [Vagococcus fluvialis]NKD50721.1 acetyl-CoA carboxylase biotin carboxyl carrier protein [Vagococcus fluvialis]